VFLAWLNEEESAPIADIEAILEEIHKFKATLIVAVTTYTEILRAKHTDEQIELFDRFLQRSNVIKVDTTFQIAQKAERIRSRAIETAKKHEKRNIKTPDATIIATAIVYGADVLHSMEPRHHKLSESDIVDGLRIMLPQDLSGQKMLDIRPN
jgi:predicted nucleic acid-binding protein